MNKFEYHPAANIFPMMSAEEFKGLKEDILENGQLEPILIDAKTGTIIDGRNRYEACLELDIIPLCEPWEGEDPVSFVLSMNLHRRHITPSQGAVVALEVERLYAEQAKERQRLSGGKGVQTITHLNEPRAREQAAKATGTNAAYVSDAKRIQQKAPELLERVSNGVINIPQAVKILRTQEIADQRAEVAEAGKAVPEDKRWNVCCADIKTFVSDKQYDFIITDPPYPREYLELYEVLAQRAGEWLKPGGLLIAMCGQSYLEAIYELMSRHIDYYWTAAYLTPGQPTPLRQVNVNTTWKPLLVFSNGRYTGKIFGDVFKSDGNDKDHHKWGQSVSGMYDIVSKMCLPGQYIFDPFCGAGTTGIAAIKHGCLFDGIDIDAENVNISKGRLHDQTAE